MVDILPTTDCCGGFSDFGNTSTVLVSDVQGRGDAVSPLNCDGKLIRGDLEIV